MTRTDKLFRYGLDATAIAFGLTFWRLPMRDPDLGWQLAGGAWIWQHQAVPLQDFINSFNVYWHDYHWLAQVLLYAVYATGGYNLLLVVTALLTAYTCKLLVDVIRLAGPATVPIPFALACLFGAGALISEVYSVRPQILVLPFIALTVRRLIQPPTKWELPYTFALTVIAANMHVYWVLVPFLWVLHRALPRLATDTGPSPLYAWGGLALLGAAGLMSPYGVIPVRITPLAWWMNYAVVWEYLTMPVALQAQIGEFRSALAVGGLTPWIMLAYLFAVARAVDPRAFFQRWDRNLAGVVFPLLAIHAVKFVSVFAVASLPFLVEHVGGRIVSGSQPTHRRFAGALLVASMVASLIVATLYCPWLRPRNPDEYAQFPLAACRHIAGLSLVPRAPRDHIRVLTPFTEGGWCRWALYEAKPDADYRVTIDGRTQGVPVQRYFDSYDLYMVHDGWLQTLNRWSPDVLLVPKTFPLGHVLLLFPQSYRLVFEDNQFAVFVPVDASASEPAASTANAALRGPSPPISDRPLHPTLPVRTEPWQAPSPGVTQMQSSSSRMPRRSPGC